MPSHSVFYSWQSDSPNATNRGFIEDCLNRAIKDLKADEELHLDVSVDRDTKDVPGSPDIAETVFDKIDSADAFIADVSLVSEPGSIRPTPNPNVLIELGWAARSLGWDRIVCVFNRASGEVENLPFDIRKRRVRSYELRPGEEKAEQRASLVAVLRGDIEAIIHQPKNEQAQAAQRLLSELGSELIDVLMLGDELEQRYVHPWLSSLRAAFQSSADRLREMATSEVARAENLMLELDDLADNLDAAANVRLNVNGDDFEKLARMAIEKARALKASRIDDVPLPEASVATVREVIATSEGQLRRLADRAGAMANDARFDDVQNSASRIGRGLLKVAYFNLDPLKPGLAAEVRAIGHRLHLLETVRLMGDGGATERRALQTIGDGAIALSALDASIGSVRRR